MGAMGLGGYWARRIHPARDTWRELEVIGMGARQPRVVLRWAGFLLIVTGFLAFLASYFLLPIYVTTLNCFDYCTPPKRATTWEFSQNLLAGFSIAPVFDSLVLVLLYLPLLAALVVMGSGLGFLANPDRAFALWIRRGALTGSIALILLFPFTLILSRPEIGYFGMLAGYAACWGGYVLYLTAHPQARYDP
jgi:hypothetical protein